MDAATCRAGFCWSAGPTGSSAAPMAGSPSSTTRPACRPSHKEVEAGFAPQLPLEAAMAEAGAFGPELAGETAELVYWHLTGGFDPGEERSTCSRRRGPHRRRGRDRQGETGANWSPRSTTQAAPICRSRIPAGCRGFPTMRTSPAWPNGICGGRRRMTTAGAADRACNGSNWQASDPAVSAFVSASAGSGKTKLLTDRLLRLMLGGASPRASSA